MIFFNKCHSKNIGLTVPISTSFSFWSEDLTIYIYTEETFTFLPSMAWIKNLYKSSFYFIINWKLSWLLEDCIIIILIYCFQDDIHNISTVSACDACSDLYDDMNREFKDAMKTSQKEVCMDLVDMVRF